MVNLFLTGQARRALSVQRVVAAILALMCSCMNVAWAKADEPLQVVASFSILGIWLSESGEGVNVSVIVDAESDAHTFEPRPSDTKALAAAQLLFMNGLDFEAWIPRLVQSAGYAGPQVVVSKGIQAIRYQDDAHGHGDSDGHDHDHHHSHDHDHDHGHDQEHTGHAEHHHHGEYDPHAWQSLSHAAVYVKNIRDALIQHRPASAELFNSNAAAYLHELDQLDIELKAGFSALPAKQRKVISSHDAFAYLGAQYGIEFISLLGVSNQAEPSAHDIAKVINQAKAESITAIFVENVVSPKLVEQVARETGAKVGGVLYSDALAKAPHEADSYLGMMRWNGTKILNAVSP